MRDDEVAIVCVGEARIGRDAGCIRSGAAEVVVISGADTQRNTVGRADTPVIKMAHYHSADYEIPYGPLIISLYALIAQRWMHEYGWRAEDFAEVAVSQRFNASYHAGAQERELITVEDVLAFYIRGIGNTYSYCYCRDSPDYTDYFRSMISASADTAYAQAGITPADVDFAFVGDPAAPCTGAPGQHLHMMEAIRQLRGECGERQVAGARYAAPLDLEVIATSDDRPLPTRNAFSVPCWDATQRHELRLQRCSDCETFRYSFTVVRRPLAPYFVLDADDDARG